MRNLHWANLTWLLLSALVIGLDLWTKHLVEAQFRYGEFYEVLPFFNLTLAYNTGAAFSFLADAGGWQRWFFVAIGVFATVLILGWLLTLRDKRVLAGGLALILGGALGNLYDRLAYGHVVDFLDFHWAGNHFPAFNIADSAITLGAILLIVDMLLEKRPERGSDSHE
ncbi:MAG: signal peptidase II [Alcanivoracaceae bacterium]|nr:signal peptidase II [Alcanivoracaceae bacterium]